jgi:hypothetical protein
MLNRWRARLIWCGVGALAASLAACGQKAEQNAAPQVEEKTFALSPASAPVKAAFLTGELQDMKVTERVEQGTGKVVDPPKLVATLKLKNTSGDETARLIAGRVEYEDTKGQPISLARKDTSFKFSSYQTERLDPGMEVTQRIDVPFPAAAVTGKNLQDIRLELTYIPTPYKKVTLKVQTSLGK